MLDDRRRLLLIERGRAPSVGHWSLPGGRCEPGETPEQACVREVAEETGIHVVVERWVGRVERDAKDATVYVIDDFLCRPVAGRPEAGRPVAGDDAAHARWVTRAQLDGLLLTAGLLEALAEWDVLPD